MNVRNGKMNVLITGGSGGIGRAAAERFFEEGFNVAIHCNSSFDEAEAFAASLADKNGDLTVKVYRADFRDPSEVTLMCGRVISDLGPVDVLVNNAGYGRRKLVTDTSYEDWRETFLINADAAFLCSRAVLPDMIRSKKGSIVNVSSMWGITGASCEVDYSAAKAALIGFTKALAKEVGPSGINVNCVAPGVVDTKMNSDLTPEDISELKNETPLMRIGTPREIAEVIYFLCTDKASFITGQVISPNGGFVI